MRALYAVFVEEPAAHHDQLARAGDLAGGVPGDLQIQRPVQSGLPRHCRGTLSSSPGTFKAWYATVREVADAYREVRDQYVDTGRSSRFGLRLWQSL
jgi:hypothetical protein